MPRRVGEAAGRVVGQQQRRDRRATRPAAGRPGASRRRRRARASPVSTQPSSTTRSVGRPSIGAHGDEREPPARSTAATRTGVAPRRADGDGGAGGQGAPGRAPWARPRSRRGTLAAAGPDTGARGARRATAHPERHVWQRVDGRPRGPARDRGHRVKEGVPHPMRPALNWDDRGWTDAARTNHRGVGAEEWQPARTASEHGRRSPSTAPTTTSSGSTRWRAPSKLPFSLKVLLENLLRTEDGADITADHIRAIANWDPNAEPDQEIQFTPARVVMQDFTGVPCIVDLATMREAMADLGGDPQKINPLAPAELVIDHSVIADVFGTPESFERNVEIEYERNGERYQFLRWGQGAFSDFKVVPPGTGIVHQVNIEHLARVVFPRQEGDRIDRLPRHLRGHRQPHHDGQRPRRAGLGRRRHRGRGGDARPARLDAHPPRRRLQADRRAAGRRHRHRPGAHDHRDAARARRGREVRRVLRRRRLRRPAGQPRHDRQHEPGVRLHRGDVPDRRGDDHLPAS